MRAHQHVDEEPEAGVPASPPKGANEDAHMFEVPPKGAHDASRPKGAHEGAHEVRAPGAMDRVEP